MSDQIRPSRFFTLLVACFTFAWATQADAALIQISFSFDEGAAQGVIIVDTVFEGTVPASVVRLTEAPAGYLLIDYTDSINAGFPPNRNEIVFEAGELVSIAFDSGEHCYAGFCGGGFGVSRLLIGYGLQSAEAQFFRSGQGLASNTALQLTVPATVPEPTTLTLLCTSLAGLGLRRNRRST